MNRAALVQLGVATTIFIAAASSAKAWALSPSASVVHGSASELWKALERFELFSITVSQA